MGEEEGGSVIGDGKVMGKDGRVRLEGEDGRDVLEGDGLRREGGGIDT